MDEKFIMVSMDDKRLKKIAEVLSNKTCQKILEHLSKDDEASQKELASVLKVSISTIEYNVKKLVSVGLIQRKNFFWSKKGRKIVMYEIANKSILISPRNTKVGSKLKSIIPGFVLVGAMSFAAYVFEGIRKGGEAVVQAIPAREEIMFAGAKMVADTNYDFGASVASPLWTWFMAGGLIALFIFSVVNWKKLG